MPFFFFDASAASPEVRRFRAGIGFFMISGRVTMTGRTRGSARLSLVCRAALLSLVPRRCGASGAPSASSSGPAVARSPWGGGGLLSRAFPLWWGSSSVVRAPVGSCVRFVGLRGAALAAAVWIRFALLPALVGVLSILFLLDRVRRRALQGPWLGRLPWVAGLSRRGGVGRFRSAALLLAALRVGMFSRALVLLRTVLGLLLVPLRPRLQGDP